MITDSEYRSLEELFRTGIRVGFMRPLIRFLAERQTGLSFDDLRPVEEIGHISPRPVLIIQGLNDSLIPTDSGQSLYKAAGEPRTLLSELDVGHLATFALRPEE